jgi:hypothetical protein
MADTNGWGVLADLNKSNQQLDKNFSRPTTSLFVYSKIQNGVAVSRYLLNSQFTRVPLVYLYYWIREREYG